MKRSIRFLLTASVLTAGLMFSAASAMAETSEEKGPGINMGASGTAAVTGEAPDGSAKETGDAADNKPGTAETSESAEGSASASGSAAAEGKSQRGAEPAAGQRGGQTIIIAGAGSRGLPAVRESGGCQQAQR